MISRPIKIRDQERDAHTHSTGHDHTHSVLTHAPFVSSPDNTSISSAPQAREDNQCRYSIF